MAAELVLRASFREHVRGRDWTAFSKTAIGDAIATVVTILLISSIFLACSLALIAFLRAISLVSDFIG
jgi:hypothetical protein